jgi:hypothetical protein
MKSKSALISSIHSVPRSALRLASPDATHIYWSRIRIEFPVAVRMCVWALTASAQNVFESAWQVTISVCECNLRSTESVLRTPYGVRIIYLITTYLDPTIRSIPYLQRIHPVVRIRIILRN